MTDSDLTELLRKLLAMPAESELVEFKEAKNSYDLDKLGEYFSALSNEANLRGTTEAWLVFGVDNKHQVVGTAFRNDSVKKLQGLIKEIADQASNRLTFRGIHELNYESKRVLLFEIPPAISGQPTAWKGHYYGRDGESLGALNTDERHRIERQTQQTADFELAVAFGNASVPHILELLDWQEYIKLFNYPAPDNAQAIIAHLLQDKALVRESGLLHITNLGAVLFARDLKLFPRLEHKGLRIILYNGTGRTNGGREQTGRLGYAVGFVKALTWLNERLPSREEITATRREQTPTYPVKAIRELVANALIHQDFTTTGSSPMVEVFDNRMEITNPGVPLINVLQFLNHTPISRNEAVAETMKALDFCERRGSGVDRIVEECEKHFLPAPDFIRGDNFTQAILYAPKALRDMSSRDKVRACYQHACLKFANGEAMSNQSFRERMGIAEKNYPMASRIIADTLEAGLIKPYDPDNKSKKQARYVPVLG